MNLCAFIFLDMTKQEVAELLKKVLLQVRFLSLKLNHKYMEFTFRLFGVNKYSNAVSNFMVKFFYKEIQGSFTKPTSKMHNII